MVKYKSYFNLTDPRYVPNIVLVLSFRLNA